MARFRQYIIECDGHVGEDGCRENHVVGGCETKQEAELLAKNGGWIVGWAASARDLCPWCVARESTPIVTRSGYHTLRELSRGDARTTKMSTRPGAVNARSALRLVEQGFAVQVSREDEFDLGPWIYQITDAGRVAMEACANVYGQGNQ